MYVWMYVVYWARTTTHFLGVDVLNVAHGAAFFEPGPRSRASPSSSFLRRALERRFAQKSDAARRSGVAPGAINPINWLFLLWLWLRLRLWRGLSLSRFRRRRQRQRQRQRQRWRRLFVFVGVSRRATCWRGGWNNNVCACHSSSVVASDTSQVRHTNNNQAPHTYRIIYTILYVVHDDTTTKRKGGESQRYHID